MGRKLTAKIIKNYLTHLAYNLGHCFSCNCLQEHPGYSKSATLTVDKEREVKDLSAAIPCVLNQMNIVH